MTKDTEQFIHPWIVRFLNRNKNPISAAAEAGTVSSNGNYELSKISVKGENNNPAMRNRHAYDNPSFK